MKKIQNIQGLRGIAVLLVVLFHLISIEKKYGGMKTILSDFFTFGMFGVDLFFVISGFVMVAITRNKPESPKEAFRFLYHRVSRIYPMYWVYSILVLIVFLVYPTVVNNSQGNQVNIWASFLLLPSKTLPLVMVGWTLIHEMYFYLIFFLVLLLISKRYMSTTILFWGILVVFLNVFLESSNPFIKLVSHPLTLEFIGGYFLAIIFFRENSRTFETRLLLMLMSICLIASIYAHTYHQAISGQIEPKEWWRVLILGLPAILTVFCFIYAERNGNIIHSLFVKIGDASYSIYLSHILTLSLFGRVWHMFASNTIYDNIILLPVLFMLAIIVGIGSYHFVEKPLLEISRKIA